MKTLDTWQTGFVRKEKHSGAGKRKRAGCWVILHTYQSHMTMRTRIPSIFLFAACLAVAACGPKGVRSEQCLHSLETSAKVSTVQTASGPVAGYIEDGVYTYKGIPYARAERFQPAVHHGAHQETQQRPDRPAGHPAEEAHDPFQRSHIVVRRMIRPSISKFRSIPPPLTFCR